MANQDATKSVTYTTLGSPTDLHTAKSQMYGVLGPPLTISCTKKVMYVITGPGYPRYRVRLIKSIPVGAA
jgi:hypothetical protein